MSSQNRDLFTFLSFSFFFFLIVSPSKVLVRNNLSIDGQSIAKNFTSSEWQKESFAYQRKRTWTCHGTEMQGAGLSEVATQEMRRGA